MKDGHDKWGAVKVHSFEHCSVRSFMVNFLSVDLFQYWHILVPHINNETDSACVSRKLHLGVLSNMHSWMVRNAADWPITSVTI